MFSASSEARDRNAPTNANQIRLQTSRIRQEHRPIRYQLPARLSFRQGQPVPDGFCANLAQSDPICSKRAGLAKNRLDSSLNRKLLGSFVSMNTVWSSI